MVEQVQLIQLSGSAGSTYAAGGGMVYGLQHIHLQELQISGDGGGGICQSNAGRAGGSGIVIVKELNKASGSWPLSAQFRSQKQGTWPRVLAAPVAFQYLVVAGGGGGGVTGRRRWWSWRISYIFSRRNRNYISRWILSNNNWSRRMRPEINVMVQHQLQGQIQYFQQLHQQVVVGEQEVIWNCSCWTRWIRWWRSNSWSNSRWNRKYSTSKSVTRK
jgi:hypothetical protein